MADSSKNAAEQSEAEETYRNRRKVKKSGLEDKTTLFLEWIYGILLVSIPFFFLGITDDVFDLNKQTLLFAGTLLVSIVYGVHIVSTQSVRVRGSFLTLGLLVLALGWLVTSVLSSYSYMSMVGLEGQASTSFATLACFAILVVIATNVFSAKHVIRLLRILIITTALLTISGLLQIFGVYLLPFEGAKTGLVYPGGLINGLGVTAAVGLVLAIAEIIRMATKGRGALSVIQILLALVTAMQLITLVIFDEWALWTSVAVSLGFMLVLLYIKLAREQKVTWLVLPSFVFVFSVTMAFINVPRFVFPLQSPQLSLQTSYDITLKALKERPLFGYGPGNFSVAYTQFRDKKINEENAGRIWAERFLQSGSTLMTLAVGIGFVGLGALLLFIGTLALKAIAWLIKQKDGDEYTLYLGIVGALLSVGTLGVLWPLDFTGVFFFWMIVGFFSVLSSRALVLIKGQHSNRFVILSSLVLFTIISVSLVGVLFASVRYAADATFHTATIKDRALSSRIQAGERVEEKDLNDLIETLEKAVKMNPYHLRYPKALSQALVYKTSALAADSKAQENLVSVKALASNAAMIAQQTVALNPQDARNMQNLADTLQVIFPFVENGYGIAQAAYSQTAKLDPQNPLVRTTFAKLYLSAYLIFSQQEKSLQKEEEKARAKEEAGKSLSEAERLLKEAIDLKPDYPEPYFHLGTISVIQEKKDEAGKYFDTALEYNFRLIPLRASDEMLFYNLGLNYEALKQTDKAQTAYKLAISLRPNYYLALWRSALLDEAQGNVNGALITLKKFLEYDPQNKTVQDKIKELENKNQPSASDDEAQQKESE